MYNEDNKNKKIPYPPIVEGYISTRILKEKITEYLITKNNQSEANADSAARSTIIVPGAIESTMALVIN